MACTYERDNKYRVWWKYLKEKGPLGSSTPTWEKTLTWRGRIGRIWLGIGICGGPFDRVMSLKGPRNEAKSWFF